MKLKSFIATLIISTISLLNAEAQDLNFIARGNLSIGADYQSLDYNGGSLMYSPGGGMGIEIGFQQEFAKGFAIQSTLGYQVHLAIQAESYNGATNKSSFTFNRKFISLGAMKSFDVSSGMVTKFHLGAGTAMHFPGTLTRTENEDYLGESTYGSNLGFYFEIGLRLRIMENLILDPAIRYRQLGFSAKSFSEGTVEDLPDHLQKLNANGIELGLTFVKTIKSN